VYVGNRVGSWVGLNFWPRISPSVADPGSRVLLIPGSGMDFFRISVPRSSTHISQTIGSPWSKSNEADKRISKNIPQFNSVADQGCLSRIPVPTCFHPGSRNRTVSIPDPGSSSKEFKYFNPKKAKKWFLSSKKYDPGCSSRMLILSHPRSRIQGSKKHPIPDPGYGSATL
jgi:hypothetical protein